MTGAQGAWDDGLPLLLDYQAAWNRDRAPVAVIEKSRRIGISWSDAAERVLHAAEPVGHVAYQSYAKDMTGGYISDCADWAKRFGKAVHEVTERDVRIGDDEHVHQYELAFPGGRAIQALTSSARQLRSRGRPGDIVVIDEAAFVDDLAAVLQAAMAVTVWGGSVRIISTHNGDDSEFADLVRDIRAGRYPDFSLHTVTLADAIGAGLVRRIHSVTGRPYTPDSDAEFEAGIRARYKDGDTAAEELDCAPRAGGSTYLPRALIEGCMREGLPVLQYTGSAEFNARAEPERRAEMRDWIRERVHPLLDTLTPEERHAMGFDVARTQHLSAIAPLAIGRGLHRTVPFVVEMRNVPHKQQEQVMVSIGRNLPRLCGVCVDATGLGSYLAEAAADEWGPLAQGVQINERFYRERWPPLKRRMEDAAITLPRDDGVLEDMRSVTLIRGVPRVPDRPVKGRSRDRHGDTAIAVLLADTAADDDTGTLAHRAVPAGDDSRPWGGQDSWIRPGTARAPFGGWTHGHA
ncbi:MAG: hypothetical protein OXB97_04640 [Rhodospirillales bacterium]|nr:hypothetical protein [Rhodospirillales bacterium]